MRARRLGYFYRNKGENVRNNVISWLMNIATARRIMEYNPHWSCFFKLYYVVPVQSNYMLFTTSFYQTLYFPLHLQTLNFECLPPSPGCLGIRPFIKLTLFYTNNVLFKEWTWLNYQQKGCFYFFVLRCAVFLSISSAENHIFYTYRYIFTRVANESF